MDFELDHQTEDERETRVNEEYRLWKKNSPFLYDTLISHSLVWPSLTCQWFPDVEKRPDKNYKVQRLLIGTHTNDEEPNYLEIASVQLPSHPEEIDMRKYEDTTNEIGGYGANNDTQIKITQKIVHEGEVNRARYQYENPNVIATKARTGDVYVFDRTMHESFPKENERFNPDLKLNGHTREGYGLSWNPHHNMSSHIISAGFDGKICQWDIGAAHKEHRVLDPLCTYTGHSSGIEDIAWHLQHEWMFGSVGDDKRLMIWDTRRGNSAIHSTIAHRAETNCIDFCPGSEWILATASGDSTAALWDLRNLKVKLHSLEGHREEVFQLAWSPHHATILATASSDRRILVWDTARIGDEQTPEEAADGPPELLFVHGGHTNKVSDFAWNPVEPWMLCSAAEDNILQVWQMASTIYGQEEAESEGQGCDDTMEQ
ncbi:WD40-repeat-containing domain protein [Radiomyces spectabilis]|uniref:WD40-repeat-containing domain protein n=1 Tax=Radiomyces spectabilis TaxID=64574 RepID=UPI002220AB34|nr:WD40-repeat-containing domain protein [Radiomyces spectabilis]KAI8373008.1 WD40-repeat-containing domain protein [Radiomyces spectabilis]